MMIRIARGVVERFPWFRWLLSRAGVLPKNCWVPPGHFYSPIPAIDELKRRERALFEDVPRQLPGVELNERGQIELLKTFAEYYRELPFEAHRSNQLRYYYENSAYSYSDAIILYCMIRHLRPKRIVEVGSGYSSCVILDTNELFFEDSISCTFIEPHPKRLRALVKDGDEGRFQLLQQRLQDVELSLFRQLSANDVLFIDSTHVSRTGSDVNYAVFEVLPLLHPGVLVHFHDVFYPFEYPKEWVYQGRAWNESYLLRAFLQYNKAFEIVFFNTFMERFHGNLLATSMPLCRRNPGGNIWIRKLQERE